MPTVDCETSEEYFYDSKQSLASETSEDSFHSTNEEVVFLAMLAGVQNMRKIMFTVITVQAQVAQRADNSHPTDKSLSSYSKN